MSRATEAADPKRTSEIDRHAIAMRRFNRFYTRQIGLLDDGYLRSPFSLPEVRVLYELAHRDGPTAAELSRDLGLDPGYLSRILRAFEKRRFISRTRSAADGRQSHLTLTTRGRGAFSPLEQRSHEEIRAILARLPASEQARLIDAMRAIEAMLGGRPASPRWRASRR